MNKIVLTQGKFALVDPEDYEVLSRHKWQFDSLGYARRTQRISGNWRTKNKKVKLFLMHRSILQAPEGMHIDHINGDRLDNRKCNLRVCTQMQNAQNVRVATAKNPFIGACLHKPTGKWQAQIRLWGKITYLGLFDSQQEASNVYKEAARKHRGEFSNVD